jgi:hypothetical protein
MKNSWKRLQSKRNSVHQEMDSSKIKIKKKRSLWFSHNNSIFSMKISLMSEIDRMQLTSLTITYKKLNKLKRNMRFKKMFIKLLMTGTTLWMLHLKDLKSKENTSTSLEKFTIITSKRKLRQKLQTLILVNLWAKLHKMHKEYIE